MRLQLILLVIAMGFLFSQSASAQVSKALIGDQESGLQRVQLIKNDHTLYNMYWTCTRVQEGGKSYLIYKIKGDNDQQGASRIDWDEESKILENGDRLETLFWKKSSRGAEQMDWALSFDWQARRAAYTFADRATGKKENKTLSFKDGSFPGDALYFVMRGFPFDKGQGFKMSGDVVMTSGDIITGNILHLGEETLDTPLGRVETYKLEIKPTGLIGMLPTKMYMWYTKKAPHYCVRFDGLEGLARTKTVMYEFQSK